MVFDAQCLLCNSWVQFLLKHDKQGIFQFAAIQGKVGGQLLADAGLKIEGLQTLLLVDGQQSWQHTDAILRVLHALGLAVAAGWRGKADTRAAARCAVPRDCPQPLPVVWQKRAMPDARPGSRGALSGLIQLVCIKAPPTKAVLLSGCCSTHTCVGLLSDRQSPSLTAACCALHIDAMRF